MKNKVVPLLVSDTRGADRFSSKEAFAASMKTGLAVEKRKIERWAHHFDFEVDSQPIMVEIKTQPSPEDILKQIMARLANSDSIGIVVAGVDFVVRAGLDAQLIDALKQRQQRLYEASSGSEPILSIPA